MNLYHQLMSFKRYNAYTPGAYLLHGSNYFLDIKAYLSALSEFPLLLLKGVRHKICIKTLK